MAVSSSNMPINTTDDAPHARLVADSQRTLVPGDAVPRLIGLGMPADAAQRLVEDNAEQRITDALDALEELDPDHRILDPSRWIDAAVEQRWDLTAVLVDRREREQRVAALDGDRRQREAARTAHPAWRVIAERWDTAISAALDDEQLIHAIDRLTDAVPGIGRRSVPVVRAELVSWAVDVHERAPSKPLDVALGEDLDRGPQPASARAWPLPEPPATRTADGDVSSLTSRITAAIGTGLRFGRQPPVQVEVAVPHRTIPGDEDVGR